MMYTPAIHRVQAASPDDLRTQIKGALVRYTPRKLKKPLQLSSGLITEITEAEAEVDVLVAGKAATGRSSIYLSDLWAWPDPALSHAHKDAELRSLCSRYSGTLYELCGGEPEHPLELGLRLHQAVSQGSTPPILARQMCASPFDAAIHDAVGIALGRSAFDLYSDRYRIPSADPFFQEGGVCSAIQSLLRRPVGELDAWLIVGARDSLTEDVEFYVRRRGYRCFKLKILGKDNAADVARTVEVYQAVRSMGVERPRLTVDSNEANPDAASVLDYLLRLRAADPAAFAALEYLEQPTGRDIREHPQDWREVTGLKPVLLDEGLTDLELFSEAVRQGWSGFALKTCKGHSFALTAAAWGHQKGLPLSLQDLTNPGLAAIHAALFAAHVPTINGVELNSPQYTPDANTGWLPRLSALLEPRDGVHRLEFSVPVGLGSRL